MATYSTDLTTLSTAESGTWVELTGTILGFTLSGAGSPAADGENYIQGTDCRSQTTGKAVDAEISIAFNNGSGVTFATDEVVFGWCYYAVGVNLKTKANSGWMFVIANSLTTGDYFVIGGSDYGRNPYGGWMNVAIDPTATQSGTFGGGGNGGTYQYFGQVCNTLNEITKGTPSAVDALRYGRGIISIISTGGSFTELASYNDYNAGGTPPGTTSTSIDTGRHRLGLFQEFAGTFLWKGLLSLGTTAASVTFSDSNETIIIDDCPHTYPSFNKIEVRNAASSVSLTNITFISTATTLNGRGDFQMIDNAAVTQSNCVFTDMGTFRYNTNATMNGTTWRRCDIVYQSGSTITGCDFDSANSSTAISGSNPTLVTSTQFISDGSSHAYEVASAGSYDWTDNIVEGYATANGSTGNEVIYNTSGGVVVINVSGGSGTVSYRNGAGATTTINSTVPVTITGLKENTEVRVLGFGTTTELAGIENATAGVSGSREFTFSLSATTATTIKIHSLLYQHLSLDYTVPSSATNVPIQQIFDRNYLNPA